jgi:PDZ domain-containing protein GIPC
MPLFGKKKDGSPKKSSAGHAQQEPFPSDAANQPPTTSSPSSKADQTGQAKSGQAGQSVPRKQAKWNFYCQLAHGSPTGIITGFANVREMYERIAECYEISWRDILFATLNTHKVDMDKLLGGQLALDDLIFAHVKGTKKEVELDKTEPSLGLTITDNGCGYAFVKRIKEGSLMDRLKLVEVGDHIEKIDGVSFVDKRHYDVANYLKAIPVGTTFIMRVISPERSSLCTLHYMLVKE